MVATTEISCLQRLVANGYWCRVLNFRGNRSRLDVQHVIKLHRKHGALSRDARLSARRDLFPRKFNAQHEGIGDIDSNTPLRIHVAELGHDQILMLLSSGAQSLVNRMGDHAVLPHLVAEGHR